MDLPPQQDLAAARAQLLGLSQSWHRRLLFSAALRAAGLAMLCFALTGMMDSLHTALRTVLAGAVFLLACAVQIWLIHRRNYDARIVARHINRILPEAEESVELLLAPEDSLTTLARLQRRRLLQSLALDLGNSLLPRQPWRTAWRFFSFTALAALCALALQPFILKQKDTRSLSQPAPSAPAVSAAIQALPVQIEKVSVAVVPPSYTGKPERTVAQFDFEAEEGAQITWQIAFDQPLRGAAFVFVNGDTLPLQAKSNNVYAVSLRAQEPDLYHLRVRTVDGKIQTFDYHRLHVTKDLPPALVVISPESRVEIDLDQPRQVRLQTVIDDDYGIRHAGLVATLARGSGEGTKFRESRLALGELRKISTRHWRADTILDLQELEMAPGDELYFYLEAADNREPEAQYSRSEVHFIALRDTTSVAVAASTGLLINPIPDYFRSQRQIIIDTEKLNRERAQLAESEFKRRSQNIGWDQRALRLRYGQFLGEEAEGEAGSAPAAGGSEHEAAHESAEANAYAAAPLSDDKPEAGEIISQFAHRHDVAENATLFAPAIKTQLKAALAEMWQAELHLRTHRPQAALPFEYRALALLKSVQQSTRAYVQRVGFEAPPIKVEEQRLRGELEKVAGGKWQRQMSEPQTLFQVRQALVVLEYLQSGREDYAASEVAVLERAARELAQQALAQPARHLVALRDLRTLITDLNGGRRPDQNCMLSVQRALWQALPPAEPRPASRFESPTMLARKYFARLGAERSIR